MLGNEESKNLTDRKINLIWQLESNVIEETTLLISCGINYIQLNILFGYSKLRILKIHLQG